MKISIVLICLILLSGCSLFGKKRTVTTVRTEEFSLMRPSAPDQIVTRSVKFKVLSSKDLYDYLRGLDALTPQTIDVIVKSIFGTNEAMFALSSKNYENLGLDMQEIKRYISQQKEIILYYNKSVPSPEEVLDKAKVPKKENNGSL